MALRGTEFAGDPLDVVRVLLNGGGTTRDHRAFYLALERRRYAVQISTELTRPVDSKCTLSSSKPM
jgi:hypothetical protein